MDGVDFAYQQKMPTKHFGIFIFVIFLHAIAIYALALRLAREVVEVVRQPVEVRLITEMPLMLCEPAFSRSRSVVTQLRLGLGDRFSNRSDWPYFDAAYACRRNFRGNLDRFIQVSRLDHVEAGKLLLGLSERTVRDGQLAVAHAHGGGRLHTDCSDSEARQYTLLRISVS